MKIIINLISKQTIPNVKFIKYHADFDRCIFLNTAHFLKEGNENWTRSALNLDEDKCKSILIDPNKIGKIQATLEEQKDLWDQATEIHLNTTGGTKMMALAATIYFMNKYKSKVQCSYIPFNLKNIEVFYPSNKSIKHQISVSLSEYLKAQGLIVNSKIRLDNKHVNKSKIILNGVLRKDKEIEYKIKNSHEFIDPKDKSIYAGEWLEYFSMNALKEQLNLKIGQYSMSTRLNKQGYSEDYNNEYDLMFLYQNKLYIGECKYFSGKYAKSKFGKEIHKMGALKNSFGLDVIPFFIFGSQIPPVAQESIQEEFKSLGIKTYATQRDLSPKNLAKFINQLIQS